MPLGCIHTPANPPLCEGTIANERKFFTLYNALPPERRVMVANAVLEPTVMAPLKKGDAGLRWRGIKKAIESILWMELDLTLVVPLVQKFETFLWKHQEAITKEINRPRGRLSDQWTADTEREFERVYVYLTYCRMLAALEQHERVDSDRFRLKYWDSKAV